MSNINEQVLSDSRNSQVFALRLLNINCFWCKWQDAFWWTKVSSYPASARRSVAWVIVIKWPSGLVPWSLGFFKFSIFLLLSLLNLLVFLSLSLLSLRGLWVSTYASASGRSGPWLSNENKSTNISVLFVASWVPGKSSDCLSKSFVGLSSRRKSSDISGLPGSFRSKNQVFIWFSVTTYPKSFDPSWGTFSSLSVLPEKYSLKKPADSMSVWATPSSLKRSFPIGMLHKVVKCPLCMFN